MEDDRSADSPIACPAARDADEIGGCLSALVRRLLGAAGIDRLRRLSGGSSQETWAFETRGAARQALILRRGPGGVERPRPLAAGLANEARLIRRAAERGVAVPNVRHVLLPADGLGTGFLMDWMEGETIGRKILRDAEFAGARPLLAAQCGAALARIHALDVADLGLRTADAAGELDQYHEKFVEQGQPSAVFELAFRWLRDHLPPPVPPTLVHGDFRLGNLMIGPDGLRGVLDWELTHFGDPMEDVAFISVPSWRFGELDLPIGGFGEGADFDDAYEAAGGRIDAPRVRWWQIFGTLKWGVVCGGMALTFRSGVDPSVERGVIGRRASETEIDLLHQLAGAD